MSVSSPDRKPDAGLNLRFGGKGSGRMILGVILAGGAASRLGGGDKTLLPLGDRPILDHIIDRLAPQLAGLALNAAGDPQRFAGYGLPVLPDEGSDRLGPLAGILVGLDWAARSGARHLLTVPGDTPFLPGDLVARLAASGGDGAACAGSAGQTHWVIGLWPVDAAAGLRRHLRVAGQRRVSAWSSQLQPALVSFAVEPFDPFFNINTRDDWNRAGALWALHGAP